MTVKTNSKLIKLSDEHYVIVDDSEQITFKDWFFDIDTKIVGQYFHGLREAAWMKITHSTEPLEPGIKPLSLSEVDELIYGFNIDKMAIKAFGPFGIGSDRANIWKSGYKACRELFKDKLFTIEDMNKAIVIAQKSSYVSTQYFSGNSSVKHNFKPEEIIQSLLPKTEWEVEFDEQGRMLIKC